MPLQTEVKLPFYSVLMSVYRNDRPEWFAESVESMLSQTWPPKEIVLVVDGPVGEALKNIVTGYAAEYPDQIRVIPLEENQGLGNAMRIGISSCSCEWIARMDADDVSAPSRCEKELLAALKHHADIVGCDAEEFLEDIGCPTAVRAFPEHHEDLVRFSRKRVPFCHPAVMMKAAAVQKAGNYSEILYLEDYDLFVRMLQSGAKGYTVKEILYHVRVGKDFYRRRGGAGYVCRLLRFNYRLLKTGWMSSADFFVRSCGNILFGLIPGSARAWLYRRLLRE